MLNTFPSVSGGNFWAIAAPGGEEEGVARGEQRQGEYRERTGDTVVPRKIVQRLPGELAIEWDDGHRGRHTLETLRNECPCASCKAEAARESGPVLLPVLVPGKFVLQEIKLVGSYAVQLLWGDGHQTGIYSFPYLRELCECPECKKDGVPAREAEG